jgi:hypothetical protein
MATLTNSFEGGTSGTTITTGNSGGASGNAFDVVNIGTNAVTAYDSTHAAHGSLSCKVATASTATISSVEWTSSLGTQTQVWFRAYLYLTANPATTISVLRFQSSGSSCSIVFLNSSGQFTMTNAALTNILTFTTAVPLNQWFRVEGFVTASASAGQIQMSLYSPMDSDTPVETHTSAATQVLTASLNQVLFGIGSNIANFGFWEDDLGLSTAGPLGPVVDSGGGASAGIVAALVAGGTI